MGFIMIEIVNKHTHKATKHDFYIGRGSPLGNPYSSKPSKLAEEMVDSRKQPIELYERWVSNALHDETPHVFEYLGEMIDHYREHGKLYLVCFCSPKSCHGDVIKEILETAINVTGEVNE